MKSHTISGTIQIPEEKRQKQLFRQLEEFALWMQKPKDAAEIKKDQRKSAPISQLPMLF